MSRIPFKERIKGRDRVPVLSYRQTARLLMRDWAMLWREQRFAGRSGREYIELAERFRDISLSRCCITLEAE